MGWRLLGRVVLASGRFHPGCTTELGKTAALSGEFAKRGVKPSP
jgi:alkyl hydroperoxide reductase subunit AhpC